MPQSGKSETMPAAGDGKPASFPGVSAPAALTIIGVIAILRIGEEVFVPLAISLLLTFALAPIVSFLRRRSIPRIAAVILTVFFAFCAVATFSTIVGTQVASLGQNIPTYQTNIVNKVRALRDTGVSGGVLDRLSGAISRVGEEIQSRTRRSTNQAAPVDQPDEPDPLPVEIVSRPNPVETLVNFIGPLIAPFTTAGLVIVVVIFMLLEREGLRDRFIRLVGSHDLHRTTLALHDAGKRVGRYLLMQLVVNTLYAVPISMGLWLLGIPNAILWGLLTLVLRFIPYIGPIIGMILPLFLAVAISPGWSLLLWVAGLFLVVELISNNVLEPWLYGSNTGLSPLAIIIAAIFWTWLWGPLGLLLSTPLTVCLVVLGRHVPQFNFLHVLFGNEPVLEPHQHLYQRLLAGDPDEAIEHAEELLEKDYLIDYYEKVGVPAMLLGEADRQRGVMSEAELESFAGAALELVEDLSDIAEEEGQEEEQQSAATDGTPDADEPRIELPDGTGFKVLCIGGRGVLDDAVAAMIAQVFAVQGAVSIAAKHTSLAARSQPALDVNGYDAVIIAYLHAQSKAHARHALRRLKRANPALRVGIYLPMPEEGRRSTLTENDAGADFVTSSLTQAAILGLTRAAVSETRLPKRKLKAPPRARTPRADPVG